MEKTQGTFFLFSLPFRFLVDSRVTDIKDIFFEEKELRFYFPYRSRPANESLVKPPLSVIMDNGLQTPINVPETTPYRSHLSGNEGEIFFATEAQWDSKKYIFLPADTIRVNYYESDGNVFFVMNAVKKLLEIIRIKSSQWWIGKLPQSGEYGGPIFAKFNREGYAAPGYVSQSIANISIGEEVISSQIWREALSDLEKGIFPDHYQSTLLNSVYYLSEQNYVSAIFELAQTLDMTVDINFRKLLRIPELAYKRKNVLKGLTSKINTTDTPQFLDQPIRRIIGKSFKESCPNDFSLIEKFWTQKRHKVAHGAPLDRSERNCYYDILAVRKFIIWIETEVYLNA